MADKRIKTTFGTVSHRILGDARIWKARRMGDYWYAHGLLVEHMQTMTVADLQHMAARRVREDLKDEMVNGEVE